MTKEHRGDSEQSIDNSNHEPQAHDVSEEKEPRKVEVKNSRGVVIGDFARVVINGIDEKVFRRFGLDVRLGFVVLALLILTTSVVIVYMLIPKQSNMKVDLGCELCIAVAGFAESSNSSEEGIGKEFGATLSRRLKDNVTDLQTDMSIEVWGPSQVGSVNGRTISELDQSAQKLAQQVGADLLVYGLVNASDPAWEVSPRFYISPDYLFKDALEVIGQDQLGHPFSVRGQPKAARLKRMNDQAASSSQLLSALVVGMTYYVTYDFETAFANFQTAETYAQSWGDPAALRFLYLMMGNSLLRQSDRSPEKSGLLEQAEIYYQRALESDPTYARPYIGLGSIAYLKALLPALNSSNPADTDLSLISQSLEYYRQADALTPEPDLAHVKEKVHMWVGQDYFAQSYAKSYTTGEIPNFQPASNEFRQVIQAYEQAPDEILEELAGDAHARLGLIARLENRLQESIDEYKRALELSGDTAKKEQYQEALATLQALGP